MIEIVFICIYITIIYLVFSSLSSKDYWGVVGFVLLLMTFSPMMQYIYFPEYKMDTVLSYRQLPFKRVWLEYIQAFILILIYKKIPGIGPNRLIVRFVSLYILVNLFQFVNTQDFIRSLNGYWLSVVNPSIFALIASKVLNCNIHKESTILSVIFKYLFIVLGLFFVISIFNFFRGGVVQYDPDYEGLFIYGIGSGLGVFRDRILMTNVFMFLPLLFLPHDSIVKKNLTKKRLILFTLGIFLILLLSNSRTMYMAVLLMLLLVTIFNPFQNKTEMIKILVGVACLSIVVNIVSSGVDITEVISDRFTNQGTNMFESAKEDERYEIWSTAKDFAEDTHYLGIGFANFNLKYAGRAGNYSNAHSMYYTTLAERGIMALIWLVYTLLFIALSSYKEMKNRTRMLGSILFIGILCFSFVVYTGEDLFNVSQVAYALPPYFIMLALSLSLSYNNIQSDESIYS